MFSHRLISITALGLNALAIFGGCLRHSTPDSEPRKRREGPPNIIFLTVDTLRADHLQLYGYPRNTMPAIEAFAETAMVFDNAVVPRGSTRPSYASMLTGLYPFRHGVLSNFVTLHDELTTLPELLQAKGYHTAGFVSNFVLVGEHSGIHQGFDVYDDFVDEREGARSNYERRAVHTVEAILEWLENDPPEPFFLFTNFIDPHGPYRPPEKYRSLFQSQKTKILSKDQIPAYQLYEDSLDFYDYLDRYDEEIRYADNALGILIEELKARDLWEDAVIVFTADHGESLGEHDIYFDHHLHIWEETTHVPLAIRLPEGVIEAVPSGGGRRLKGLCSPMDLMPTVLDWVNVDYDAGLDGRSLVPMMNGVSNEGRFLFLVASGARSSSGSRPGAYAVRTKTHKFIRIVDRRAGKLLGEGVVNIGQDPLEQQITPFDKDLPLHQQLANRMESIWNDMVTYQLPFSPRIYQMPLEQREGFVKGRPNEKARNTRTLTKGQAEKLRSLGYVK